MAIFWEPLFDDRQVLLLGITHRLLSGTTADCQRRKYLQSGEAAKGCPKKDGDRMEMIPINQAKTSLFFNCSDQQFPRYGWLSPNKHLVDNVCLCTAVCSYQK